MQQSLAQQYLTLALFVILLAFFVFLNSLAQLDAGKTRAVARSLGDALALNAQRDGGEVDLEGAVIPNPPGSGEQKGRGDVPQRLATLETLFRARVPGLGVAMRSRGGTQMRMEGDAGGLEDALARARRGEGSPFSGFLEGLLTAGADGPALEIALTLGGGAAPADLSADAARQATLRVAAIARALEALGAPEGLVLAGLGPGRVGWMEITVREAGR